MDQPPARHCPAHPPGGGGDPLAGLGLLQPRQGPDPQVPAAPQESGPQCWRGEARGDLAAPGPVPSVQAGQARQGGVAPADHGARLLLRPQE